MALEHLWATWRSAYVTGITDGRDESGVASDAGADVDGRTLFERILAAPGSDDDKQIVNWDNSWPFVDAANPRIELVITTLEEWNGTLFDEEVDFDALRGK